MFLNCSFLILFWTPLDCTLKPLGARRGEARRGEARRAWKRLQDIPDVTHHARPIFSAGLARAGVDLIEVEGGGVEIVYASRGCARGTAATFM